VAAGARDAVTADERVAAAHAAARAARPLGDETERVLEVRFARVPHRVAFALRRWPLERSAVLDVGCSFGQALVHFGPGSVGIDNSARAVEFCRAIGLDARLADVERDLAAAAPEAAFDLAWVSDVVEHLDAPRVALRGVARALRPDGRLLLHVSTLPESRVARSLLRRRGVRPFDAESHFHQLTLSSTRHLLARAGFRVAAVTVPVPPRLERATPALPPRWAPRLLFEAVRDRELEAAADRSERRNRDPA
jgi:SAM-dependent methyltransferase